jgi:ADP-ribose pyrophosphatase YjhB (NUDIX family)
MMEAMKPVKRSVAVVIRRPGGAAGYGAEFLIVRRPDDPDDPLAGIWGLPAVSLRDGEDERSAVVRAGRVKLGVDLAPGARIGEKTADRGGYRLRLADYEATVLAGVPAVPQPDQSMTQYTECRYTADPAALAEAAARGSLCAQVLLQDNSKKRPKAAEQATGEAEQATGEAEQATGESA